MKLKHLVFGFIYTVAAAVYLFAYHILNLIIDEFGSKFSIISVPGVLIPVGLAIGIVFIMKNYISATWLKRLFLAGSLIFIAMPFANSVSKLAMNQANAVNPVVHAELKKRFNETMQSASTGTVIDFAAISDFEWDRMIVFGPYSTSSQINEKLGYTWTRSSLLLSNETDYMILFVHNGKVVQYLMYDGSMDSALLETFLPKSVKLVYEKPADMQHDRVHLKPYKN